MTNSSEETFGKKLESKYKEFWFESWNYRHDATKGELIVELKYSFDKEVNFTETLTLPVTDGQMAACDVPALERALKALHLIGGTSYYKAFLPSAMAGVELNADEAAFWMKVYQRGFGEFFYRNKIDFRGLINFPISEASENGAPAVMTNQSPLSEGALVPIGGGKDSLVTAEILKDGEVDFELFSLRDAKPIAETARVVDKPRIVVDRQIDPLLFKLNEEGAWNGHTPITAYISFLLVVAAVLYGKKFIPMSLEKSANSGQLIFHGMDVNHQYSKSEEFEGDFRSYVGKYIHPEIEFFSFLRGFDELKIAKIFARLTAFDEYSNVFTSCNTNFKIYEEKGDHLWCCKCPKCAFVFLILAPFVKKERMLKIFGKDLLNTPELEELFEEILGLERFKPFECVGTKEESRVALWLISQKAEWQTDLLVSKFAPLFQSKWADTNWEEETKRILTMSTEHFIPNEFVNLLKQYAD
jgi:UDP-N-acetyl-alpha-D-muramoyl-L-alanyl-L-glutamate epimerase